MTHLTPATLGALLDGALGAAARREAERHLETCGTCRDALAALGALDRDLAGALEHDPGDAYFVTFADRVAGRLGAAGSAARAATRASDGGWWRGLLSPRGMTLVGSAAGVLVVGLLVYFQSQESHPSMVSRELAARLDQKSAPSSPTAPAPPSAAGARTPVTRSLAVGAPTAREGQRAPESRERAAEAIRGGAATEGSAPVANSDAAPPAPAAMKALAPDVALGAKESAPRELDDVGRREAGAARSNLVPVAPGARGEEVPMGTAARDAPRATAAPAPAGAVSGSPTDVAAAKARQRFDRAATPLDKRQVSAGSTNGFAATPHSLQAPVAADESGFDWPPGLHVFVAAADSLTALARVTRRAADHAAAATAWNRVRARAVSRGEVELEARRRIADERVAAYAIEPTAARTDAARRGLESVLELEPPGPSRQHYEALLSSVR